MNLSVDIREKKDKRSNNNNNNGPEQNKKATSEEQQIELSEAEEKREWKLNKAKERNEANGEHERLLEWSTFFRN